MTFDLAAAAMDLDAHDVPVRATPGWQRPNLRVPYYGVYTYALTHANGTTTNLEVAYAMGGPVFTLHMPTTVRSVLLSLVRKYRARLEHGGKTLAHYGISPKRAKQGGKVRIRRGR